MNMRLRSIIACVAVSMALAAVAGRALASGNDDFDRAEQLYAHSRFDEAIEILTKAQRNDPRDARILFLRARAYYSKADFIRALADLDAGLVLSPDDVQARYNRAVVHYSVQDYDRAWDDVSRAISSGYRPDPVFFEQLKEDSGRQE